MAKVYNTAQDHDDAKLAIWWLTAAYCERGQGAQKEYHNCIVIGGRYHKSGEIITVHEHYKDNNIYQPHI